MFEAKAKLLKSINNSTSRVNAEGRFAIVIALLGIAVWSQVLTFGFVWDDVASVVTNPSLQQWSTLWRAFANDFWALHETPLQSGYWRPLPTLVDLFTAKIFGTSPAAFHAVNLLLHLGVSLLIYAWARRLIFSAYSAAGAAIFFALHPLHAEAVSFVSALPDLLSAALGLGALFLWDVRESKPWRGVGAIVGIGLALLSKESALAFVIAAIALDLCRKRRRFVEWGILLMLAAGYLFLHWRVTHGVGVRPLWGGEWDTHLATVARVFPFNAFLTLVPIGTTPTRWFPLSSGLGDPFAWVGLSLLSILILFGWRMPRFRLGLVTALLFYLPISNLLPSEGLLADRYLYLPVAGVAILLGESVSRTKFHAAWLGGLAILWGGWAFQSARPWRNEVSLWKRAIEVSPRANIAWNEWGKSLLERGELGPAYQAFVTSISLTSRFPEAERNAALALLKSGNTMEARARLEEYLQREPEDAEGWDLLGAVEATDGNLQRSVEASRRAAQKAPENWKYLYNLGTVLISERNFEEALRLLSRAKELAPDRVDVRLNLAAAYVHAGELGEARREYEELLRRWPDEPRALTNYELLKGARR